MNQWSMRMNTSEPKQMIVVRTDLRNSKGQKVRTGKLIAQGAHASLKAVLSLGEIQREYSNFTDKLIETNLCIPLYRKMIRSSDLPEIHQTALIEWMNGKYTKVCVSVNSEQELLQIYQQAKDAGLLCSLVTDVGLTEFDGVPTHTVVAIGPAFPDEVDKITGKLPLL